MSYERAHQPKIQADSIKPASQAGSGEGPKTPQPKMFERNIKTHLLPVYSDVAQRMAALGVGTVSVAEAEIQRIAGQPVTRKPESPFITATFTGTQQDLQVFHDVVRGVDAILNPLSGSRRPGKEEDEAVEKAIQEGLENEASKRRMQAAILNSILKRD